MTVALLVSCALAASCERAPAPVATGRQVIDAIGRHVTVAERPSRIISLAPNLTEIVFALGAGDRLVGDTTYCDFPEEAKAKEHVGNTLQPDLERIVALKPDLVLVSTSSQLEDVTKRLERVGVPAFVSEERDLDGVLTTVEKIADLLGDAARGRELAASLRARADAVRARVGASPPPQVFVMVGDQPLITAGKNTFVTDLVGRAGGRSISDGETADWPQFSAETVIARAPDVIVIPASTHGIGGTEGALPSVLAGTPAARQDRVLRIDANLLLRPGPRLVDGLETLARGIHPEAFR